MTNTEQMVMNLGWIDCGHLDGQQIYLSTEDAEDYMSQENIDAMDSYQEELETIDKLEKWTGGKVKRLRRLHGVHCNYDDLPF
tara:strand:+ start:1085 stop:1333 length:249 start_codon:yes stop_codon:yes gene_type:complete